MNTKVIFSIIIVAFAGIFVYMVVIPFKEIGVDNVSCQLSSLETAYAQATQQLTLKSLRLKKNQLQDSDITFLQKFFPEKLHASLFVYNLTQFAVQNRMNITGIQYTVIDDQINKQNKKLLIELTLQARYEDFQSWLNKIERSDTLIDVDSITASKRNVNDEAITFNIKMYAYGVKID